MYKIGLPLSVFIEESGFHVPDVGAGADDQTDHHQEALEVE